MTTQEEILEAVKRERLFQNARWGTIEDHPHEVGAWITLMRKELQEAENEWCDSGGDIPALMEILQVIALGFACLEQHYIVERQ